MRHHAIGLGFLAAIALAAPPAIAASAEEVRARIETLHGDADGFDDAFDLLREAMRFGDPVTVADLGAYPLRVAANGEEYDVLEPEDLVENFDALIMPETQGLVAEQDYGDLFVNSDGVMFGDGELWMALTCLDQGCAKAEWRIIAINN